jgi:tetratricopeptide (TPR) repeat protein
MKRPERFKMFVSFAGDDREFVNSIEAMLGKVFRTDIESVNVEKMRQPGAEFGKQVANSLRDCQWFAVLLTKDAMRNQWVNQEIGYAECLRGLGKITAFIPVVERQHDTVSGQWNVIDTKGFIDPLQESVPYKADREQWQSCLKELEACIRELLKKGRRPTPERLIEIANLSADSGYLWEAAENLRKASELYIKSRKLKRAVQTCERAASIYKSAKYNWEAAGMYNNAAEIRRKDGRFRDAAQLLINRAETLDGYPFERGQSYEKAGDLMVKAGPSNGAWAVRCYRKAIPSFKEEGWEVAVNRCEKKIAGLQPRRR